MKSIAAVLIALILALSLAACSGGTAQPGGSAPAQQAQQGQQEQQGAEEQKSDAPVKAPDEGQAAVIEPEQLISKEEAAGIAGDVKDGKKTEQKAVGQKICFYETANASDFLQISLTQTAFMDNDFNTPESIYMTTKDAVADEEQDTADGIGDEYFFGTPGLHILYKDYYICIAAGSSDSAKVRDMLKQAGALAVSNLDAILAK
jgi:hypothetical protein